jgi:iron complex transport system ATP-binding protein
MVVSRVTAEQILALASPEAVIASGAPALEVEGLSAAYGDHTVLHEVGFRLQPGSILALIGPNGAGKSSLIRVLSGVLPLKGGRVRVAGHDLDALSALDRARLMAVVPQARSLPPAFTAWETVLLGRTPHLNWLGQASPRDEAAAREAMQRTRTLELAERRVGELSGGEQQRLLLARALAQAAPILLLDEPTTHLDLKYQAALLDVVRGLARHDHLTVVLALHDLNLVAHYTDQVALLVGGRLRAFGRPGQVLTTGLLSEAFDVPLRVEPSQVSDRSLILPNL